MGIVSKKFERVEITAELHVNSTGSLQEENFIRELEFLIKDLKKFRRAGYTFKKLEDSQLPISVTPTEGGQYDYTLVVKLGKSSTHPS